MFRQCAGDAAPGSSQTALGSGSLLLAPLSNFRARDPAYYCVFTTFPQTRDGQSACMSGCLLSISQSLLLSISLCLCVPLSLFCSHSLFFACCHSLFLWLSGSRSQSSPLHLSLCVGLVLCLQDYRSAVSLTLSKSCSALPLSLVKCLPQESRSASL